MTVGRHPNSAGDDTKSSNVKVVVRIRPENRSEKEGPFQVILRDMNEHVLAFDPKEESGSPARGFKRQPRDLRKRRNKDLKFAFDYVFGPCSTNTEVYEQTTKTILDGLLEGYNCSVFAYGATGAGKTHTMLGSENSPGVIYHTMIELYQRIANMKDEKTCDIAVSYLEVYNEQIKDLLLPRGYLPIREDPKSGVLIPGLSLHKPKNAEELLYMLQFGNQNRSQHPTDANAESSRSHAVFQVFVRQKDRTANISAEVKVAKMCLVDLAGSERATVTKNRGARFREGANINRSLLALGNVINTLAENKSKGHIPYRDSKLTRLLKDSLGGNCRTVMIAAVSPSSMSYEDTYNTLKYADRAKNIKATLKKNILSVDFHISRYGQIVEDLRREISELKDRLQKYEEGKMTISRRKSSVSEEHRLKAILENIFEARLEIRKEQLRLECAYRDVQWKIVRKGRCLQRLKVISNSDQSEVCERAERNIKSLYSKLDSLARKREAQTVSLEANQDWLNRVQAEINMAGTDNKIPELLEVGLRMHHLEVEVSDSRQHTRHLTKLAKSQEREATASERLVNSLLQLVRKQHFILKGHNLATSDLMEEYEAVSGQVDGHDVTWEDEARDVSPVPISDIVSLPLLQAVTVNVRTGARQTTRQRHTSGGAQRVVTEHLSAGPAGRVVNGSVQLAVDTSHSSDQSSVESPDLDVGPSHAGHTPACKKFALLHTAGEQLPSQGQAVPQTVSHGPVPGPSNVVPHRSGQTLQPSQPAAWNRLNDTFTRNSVTESYRSDSSNSLESTFTLEAPHVPCLPLVEESSKTPARPTSTPPFVPKINFELVSQSPLSRISVVRQTVDSLDENSPFRRTVCIPRNPNPAPPSHCASPIPVPPAVQAVMRSQSGSDLHESLGTPPCNILQQELQQSKPLSMTEKHPGVNLVGSSTVTKSHPNLQGSTTVTKSTGSLHGSSTVTKLHPVAEQITGHSGQSIGVIIEKENDWSESKRTVKRAITFGSESPDHCEGKSYADVLKTPSPGRLPLKPLENNTPLSSPQLPANKAKSTQPSRHLPENRLYKSSLKSEENARILNKMGLPSMASRTAPRPTGSKPRYMSATKAVSQRCRQLFSRVSKEETNTATNTGAAKRVIAEPQPTQNKSLARMRSKSMSNLQPRNRWQH